MAYARRVRRRGFLGTIAALGAAACSSGPNEAGVGSAGASLDELVARTLDDAKLPAIAAAIVKGGRVALAKAWGVADVAADRAAAVDTIFVMGSVSKTVTGATILQLVEKGTLALDADVNDYLGFAVRNPKHPDVPITLRMLMAHTSSIQESSQRLVKLAKPGDPTTTMRELLEPYLVPGGATYREGESYGDQKPGERYVYSNFGAALAALVAETVAGESFFDLAKKGIFAPLGLSGTSFRIADLDPARLSIQHSYDPVRGQVGEPASSVPYYPSTALRTTAPDLARFLAAIVRGGEIDGVRILKTESVEEMLRAQTASKDPNNDVTGNGLLWELRPILGAPCAGHGGSFYGASTRMHMRRSDGVGVIMIANGDVHLRLVPGRDEHMDAWMALEARLFEEAARL